jgi:hypothetical protein
MSRRQLLTWSLLLAWSGLVAVAAEEKKEKEPAQKSGTVTGVVAGKGDNYIEVKADGEEKARRYVPHWRGGAPAQGGGLDKKMLQTFRTLKIGDRIRLEWEFEERARAVKVEVLKPAAKKEKE